MARLPRYSVPGVRLHLIQRGNNRQVIFADDADFTYFRDCLLDAAHREGLAIHAYVFMTNHVHLLATPAAETSAEGNRGPSLDAESERNRGQESNGTTLRETPSGSRG